MWCKNVLFSCVRPTPCLLVIALVLPLMVAGWGQLYNETDGQYAAAAQTMASGGSWLIPENNGIPRLVKPPLLYWCIAISFKIFGINEFAARVPNALAVWVWVIFTCLIGLHLGGRQLGLLAGWILLTFLGTFTLGRIIMPEPLFAAFMAGAFYCVLQGYQSASADVKNSFAHCWRIPHKDELWYLGFWLCVGLACFVKGWHGVVFAVVIVLSAALSLGRGSWKKIHRLFSWHGILLFILINAPWFIFIERTFPGYLNYFLLDEVWGHVAGTDAPATNYTNVPRLQFLMLHIAWFFPWSIIVLGSLRAIFRARHVHDTRCSTNSSSFLNRFGWRLVWCWGLVVLGVLMLAGQRQDYYAMVAWPALAMGIARIWSVFFHSRTKLLRGGVGLLGLLFVVGALIAGFILSSSEVKMQDTESKLLQKEVLDQAEPVLSSFQGNMADRATAWTTIKGFDRVVWRSVSLVMLVVCLSGTLLTGLAYWFGYHNKAASAFATIVMVAVVTCFGAVLGVDKVAPYFSHAAHARYLLHKFPVDTVIYFDGRIDTGSSLLFYLGRPIVLVNQDPNDEFAVRKFRIGRDRYIDDNELRAVFTSRENAVLITENSKVDYWKKKLGFLVNIFHSGSQSILKKWE